MKSHLLDELERLLAVGLRDDARRARLTEANARLLLGLPAAEPVTMSTLALRIGRTASTTTRFVDRAEREGLMVRESGRDRRRRLVRLTEAGREARTTLLRHRDVRMAALPRALQQQTGLGAEQAEWFLEAVVAALKRS